MHVFIDTNILLSFYHFTSDDLDALNSVFVSHAKGAILVHLTDQVRDEFRRNRETKIGDALKRFKSFTLSQLPYFVKNYTEYDKLQKIGSAFKKKHAELLAKAENDIKNEKLAADQLIGSIFDKSQVLKTTPEIYRRARMRVDIGNPPGKNGSLGDAINWLLLLKNVPKKQPLYLITEDADYYSSIDDGQISGFLRDEWKRIKKADIHCYRNLTEFLKDNYDGVELSFDPEKKALIDELESTGSFAATHAVVAQLEDFKYFSLQEAIALLDAALSSTQFGWIASDSDVKDLMRRAIIPHKSKLKDKKYKNLIAGICSDDT